MPTSHLSLSSSSLSVWSLITRERNYNISLEAILRLEEGRKFVRLDGAFHGKQGQVFITSSPYKESEQTLVFISNLTYSKWSVYLLFCNKFIKNLQHVLLEFLWSKSTHMQVCTPTYLKSQGGSVAPARATGPNKASVYAGKVPRKHKHCWISCIAPMTTHWFTPSRKISKSMEIKGFLLN